MSRFTRVGLGLVVAVVVFSGLAIHVAAQNKNPIGATAQIAIIRLDDGQKKKDGFSEDYLASQSALLKSRLVADMALRSGKLDHVPSLKDKDGVATIARALKVDRSKNADNPILKVSVTDLPGQDAVAVLEAIIAAYQHHVQMVYQDLNENVVKQITERSNELEKEIQKSDEALETFFKETPVIRNAGGINVIQREAVRLAEILAELRIKQRDISSTLDAVSEASKRQDTAEAVKIKAREWGKNIGLAPTESTVEAYLASMRLDATLIEKRVNDLGEHHAKLIHEVRALLQWENKELTLRERRDRVKGLYANVQQLIRDNDLRKGNQSLIVRVIEKPHVVD